MNIKEEINFYIEERQDVLTWIAGQVDLEILDEVVIFITNEIKQKYQTDILRLRDQENQHYEIEQVVDFKRPHTFITIPQRHDVKTLAKIEIREQRNVYHITNELVRVDKFKGNRKVEQVDYALTVIKKLNQKYLETLQGIFDGMLVQPKKRTSINNSDSSLSPIQIPKEPESPKFGQQQQKESVSPSWISRKSYNEGKKNDLRQLTLEEVAQHNISESAWIVINQKVYDVTHYLNKHPGGKDKLMLGVGQDGTQLFMNHHPWVNAHYLLENYQVGFLINHK